MRFDLSKIIILILISSLCASCSQTEKEECGFKYYETSFLGKVGIKDYYSDETIVPTKFDSVVYWCQSAGSDIGLDKLRWYIAYKNGLAELYSQDGTVIIKRFEYSDIVPLVDFRSRNYISLRYLVRTPDNRVGQCNVLGKEIIPCVYEKVFNHQIYKWSFQPRPRRYESENVTYWLDKEYDNDGKPIVEDELTMALYSNYIEVFNHEGDRIIDKNRKYYEINCIYWTSQYFIVGKQRSGRIEMLSSKGDVLFGDFADVIELEYTGSRLPYFVSHLKEGDMTKRVYDIKGNFLFEVSAINDKDVEIFYDDDKGFGYEYWGYDEYYDDYDWQKTYVGKRIRYWE